MSDLLDRVVEAMKATGLNCAEWHPESLRKLAGAAVEAVRTHELAKLELAGCYLPPEPGQRSKSWNAAPGTERHHDF